MVSRAMKQLMLLSSLVACSGNLLAQTSTGTIVGQVRDGTGAVVPNADVKLTLVANGTTRDTKTNASGDFSAPVIPPGEYNITVSAQGFAGKTLTGITLLVDQTLNLTINVQVGAVGQSIEVEAAAPLVDSVTSSLGQVVEEKQILNMPLNGRNPYTLGLLVGNTTPLFGVQSNLPFIAGGGRFTAVDVSLDGVDNNTVTNLGNIGRTGIAIVPSVDAVQEFKVETNNFPAEFGHAAGSVVNTTLKNGTNQFHGVVFEFLRNNVFDANNFFTNLAGLPRPPFHQNQFGGTLGGPILKKKLFFFIDYQGTRQSSRSGSSISNLPPAAFRTGDFSSSPIKIYDPTTRHIGPNGTVIASQFPGNKIPASMLNKTSTAIVSLIPATNFGNPGDLSRNFFYQAPQFSNTDQGDVRIDYTISSKNTLYGSFSKSNNTKPAVGAFAGFLGGGSPAVDNSMQLALTDVHIVTPNLINEVRFGLIRHNGSLSGTGQAGVPFAQANNFALFPGPVLGFGTINFNYSGVQSGTQEFTVGGGDLNNNIETRGQLGDNVTWTHGKHAFKFGVDLRNARLNTLRGSPVFAQEYYGAVFTSSSDAAGSGLPFADFLLGYPSSILGAPMLEWGRQRDSYFGGFAQDDWKVNSKLVLNLGVRYELYTEPIDARNAGSLFDIRTGKYAIPCTGGYSCAIVDGDHNNWGPRIGASYQISSKFVVRSGYGIFYGLKDQNQQITQFSDNPPNIPIVSLPNVSASATVTPPFTINTPIKALPVGTDLSGFSATNPLGSSFRTQAFNHALNPMLQQYNLDLQYQLTNRTVLEISYSGAKGQDLATLFQDQNQIPFSQALAGLNKQANRPFPYINGQILAVFSTATSNYNAGNVKFEMRPSHGLSVLANYTLQKNLETGGSGPNAFTQNGGTSIAISTYEPQRENGLAPINISHNATVSASYELPFGKQKAFLKNHGAVLDAFVGGWIINVIGTLRTGFPTDIRTNVLPPVFNTYNVASCVPGVAKKLPNPGVNGYFNPAAFTVPVTVVGAQGQNVQTFGNCGHFPTTGPGYKNLDSSIFKDFHYSDRSYAEFRAEFFDTTNTPSFTLPAANDVTLTCQGSPGAACNASNANFGKLSNGSATGRQIQFSLKIYY